MIEVKLENIHINKEWKEVLKNEFLSDYFLNIKVKLLNELKHKTVFPPNNLIFNAFNITPFSDVKVIILGQDPYHNPFQAMGLSFSVANGIKIPPSLKNIYKEIYDDLKITEPNSGDLTYWAKQGVLLLNSTLTVNANEPNSHKDFGWQEFTDNVIKILSEKRNNLVFMLWGNFAKSKEKLIDHSKHLVLTSAHPSPLSRGAFFGCRHFSKCNDYLKKHNIKPIDWNLNNYKENICH